MKIEKDVLSTTIQAKKEAITMIKKCLAITLASLIVIFNVLPAQAYTQLQTPVAITATGTLSGTTVAFTASVVTQATGTALPGGVNFAIPAGLSDSGAALKISGGTNEIGGRIIIYTDNASYFSTGHDPAKDSLGAWTGIDGAGLVGQSDAAYTAAMYWGVKSGANYEPNTNMDYVFGNPQLPVDGGLGNCVFVVDKRHNYTITTKSALATSLDSMPMYALTGTTNLNTPNDGLYPQNWDTDLYDLPAGTSGRVVVSEALYKNIATVASGVSTNIDTVTPANSSYVCNVPKLTTTANNDSVIARLTKYGVGTTDNYLYLYIGADFTGKPAQIYTTNKLYVAMIKD